MDRSKIYKTLLEKENKRLVDENYMFQLTIKHNAVLIEQQEETITSHVENYKELLEQAKDSNRILQNNNLLIRQQIESITILLNQNKNLTSELESYRKLIQNTPE